MSLLKNIVYIDPTISSAGDGSTPETALSNLPECSALADDTCYIIRRTTTACTLSYSSDNTNVSKIAIFGFPQRGLVPEDPNDENKRSDFSKYSEMPEAAKTAWGNDTCGTRPVILMPNNVQQTLSNCTFIELYNINFEKSSSSSSSSSMYGYSYYGFYLNKADSVNQKIIRIKHCRFEFQNEAIDSSDFTTTPANNAINYFYATYFIKELTFSNNVVCMSIGTQNYYSGSSYAFYFVLDNYNYGACDINLDNNTYYSTTYGTYNSSFYSQLYFIYFNSNGSSCYSNVNFKITDNICEIRKSSGNYYPGLFYINNLQTYGNMIVQNLYYYNNNDMYSSSSAYYLPDFGVPSSLVMGGSVLYAPECRGDQRHVNGCSRLIKNLRVYLPEVHVLNCDVVNLSNYGKFVNNTIYLCPHPSAQLSNISKQYMYGDSSFYAALCISGYNYPEPNTEFSSNYICLGAGNDYALRAKGIVCDIESITGRVIANNSKLNIDKLTWSGQCFINNTNNNLYYGAAATAAGIESIINISSLILSGAPESISGIQSRALNLSADWGNSADYARTNNEINVISSNYPAWLESSVSSNFDVVLSSRYISDKMQGIIINYNGADDEFVACDWIHNFSSCNVFREGSSAIKSLKYTSDNTYKNNDIVWQNIGTEYDSNSKILLNSFPSGTYKINFYGLINGITLDEIDDYFIINYYWKYESEETTDFEKFDANEDSSTWVNAPEGAIPVYFSLEIQHLYSTVDSYIQIKMRGANKNYYLDPNYLILKI